MAARLESTTTKSTKKAYLEKWKDRPGHKVNLFLHTKAGIAEVYRHGFYRIGEVKDEATGETSRRVLFTTLNCHEDVSVSRRQNKRDANGARVVPPVHCPICKTAEYLRSKVTAGELAWTDPVFSLKGTTDTKVIRAGAFYNAFGGDKLTEGQKQELRNAGLDPREAWKENHSAKASIVLRVVDADDVEKGIQIAIEPTSVGDAIRKVIRDTRESKGDNDGNPILNPYCIQLDYDKNEMVFGKKYQARMIEKIKMNEAIAKLIRETEAPELGMLVEVHDPVSLRDLFEKSCLLKDFPFDQIFGNAKSPPKREEQGGEREPQPAPVARQAAPQSRPAPAPQAAPPAPKAAPLYECDTEGCKGLMKATDHSCPECKRVYIETAPPAPPSPPAPARQKRGEAQAVAAVTPHDEDGDQDALPF